MQNEIKCRKNIFNLKNMFNYQGETFSEKDREF
jgi:hypothetical protein